MAIKLPRSGSRKAVVLAAYGNLGLVMAIRIAQVLRIKEGTVRTWASTWKSSGVSPKKNLSRIPRKRNAKK